MFKVLNISTWKMVVLLHGFKTSDKKEKHNFFVGETSWPSFISNIFKDGQKISLLQSDCFLYSTTVQFDHVPDWSTRNSELISTGHEELRKFDDIRASHVLLPYMYIFFIPSIVLDQSCHLSIMLPSVRSTGFPPYFKNICQRFIS